METNIERVRALSEEEFDLLLNLLNIEQLGKILEAQAPGFSKNSQYHKSKMGSGTFWRGFRPGAIPSKKIVGAYKKIVYDKSSKEDCDFFIKLINKLSEEGALSEEDFKNDSKLYKLYTTLFGLECDEKIVKKIDDFNNVLDKIDKKHKDEIEDLNKQIKSLEETIESLQEAHAKYVKEKDDEINELKKNYNSIKQNIIENISRESSAEEFSTKYNKFKNDNEIKEYLKKQLDNNLKLYKEKKYLALADELTFEYIIASLLGESHDR